MPDPIHTHATDPDTVVRDRGAFTLIELLTVIAIIGILAAILLSVLGSVLESARAAQCISNLRTCGTAIQVYSIDHGGVVPMWAHREPWVSYLTGETVFDTSLPAGAAAPRTGRGNHYLDDPNAGGCPSFEPHEWTYTEAHRGRIYGTLADPVTTNDPGNVYRLRGFGNTSSNIVRLDTVRDSSQFWLLADSYNLSWGEQVYIIRTAGQQGTGIHLRHKGRANLLFADGHVEAAGPQRLKNLPYFPFLAGYNERGMPEVF